MSRMLSTLACTALTLCALLATACQPNLENNAQFQDKVDFINRLDGQIKSIDQVVERNSSVLKQIADNMKTLNAESRGGANDAVVALEQRVQALENSLKTANDMIASMETRLKEATTAQNRLAGASKSATQDSPSKSVALKPASSGPTEPVAKKPAPARVTGKYHLVKAGETIESISKEYKITASSLASANHLPQDSKLMAGQRVFVPSSSN